jgi:N-acetyltransferase
MSSLNQGIPDWNHDSILEGARLRLEPIAADHAEGIWKAGNDPAIWQWMPLSLSEPGQVPGLIAHAVERSRRKEAFTFTVFDRETGACVGSSSYLALEPSHRRLEIGFTWVSHRWQRTYVNTEAKLLLLEHAFGRLGCHRVEFKTDVLNRRSREALMRIGAREEGVFRKHMVVSGGRVRDSVYFSITDEEWPGVRASLVEKLQAGPGAGRLARKTP